MKLGYPLNDSLPSIEHARDRLLARLYHYRQDESVSYMTTDEDYALLYAYGMLSLMLQTFIIRLYGPVTNVHSASVLVTGQLGNQINRIIQELSKLLGVLHDDILAL